MGEGIVLQDFLLISEEASNKALYLRADTP